MNALARNRSVLPLGLLAPLLVLVLALPLVAQDAQDSSQDAGETASAEAETKPAEAADAKQPEQRKGPESDTPKQIELDAMFEAVKTVPVRVTPEEWSELKVVEAVSHGTRVERGDVLIRLETEKLDRAIEDTELELKLDRLSLAEAELKFRLLEPNQRAALQAAEDADRVATEDLKEFITRGREERIESVEQTEKSSRNRLAYEEEELKQLEKMYEADDLTEETEEIILKRTRDSVDSARYSLKTVLSSGRRNLEYMIPRMEEQLKTAVKKAALALEELRETTSLQRKQQELQLQKQREALTRKEEKLAQLRSDRRLMEITAPRPGVVYYGESKRGKWSDPSSIEAMLQPGGMLKPKVVILTIVQPDPLQLRVAIPEASLRHFQPGTEVSVRAVAYPDEPMKAKVREVAAIPMADGSFDAWMKIDVRPLEGRLVPGMKAKVTVTPVAE